MNVGTYLLFTVPLVGGSLFVYDSLRREPAHTPAEDVALSAAPTARPEAPSGAGPALQADPTAMVERIAREAVERMLRERGPAAAVPSRTEVVGSGGREAPVALSDLPAIEVPGDLGGDAPVGRYDERSLKVLRAYMEEVERRQREERTVEAINDQLTRLGVALTDSQRKSVVDATVRHQQSVRETLRNLPPGQEGREARTAAMQQARDAFSKQVFDLVPAAEAERIVNSLGQGWRREGGNAPGAGGGGGGGGNGGGGGGRRPEGGN